MQQACKTRSQDGIDNPALRMDQSSSRGEKKKKKEKSLNPTSDQIIPNKIQFQSLLLRIL